MNEPTPRNGLQLRSLLKSTGELELSLMEMPAPTPGPGQVLVQVDAAPLNPSDLGLLFGAADLGTAESSGSPDRPVLRASVPPKAMKAMAGRLDQSLAVGNEGAGRVVEAGSSAAAQALRGRTVAVLAGAMYSQFRCVDVEQCLVLPEGATAADGASCFVNPLTALGMVETMRREGHSALVHTAAASNLGQMLNRICLKDGIGLVNVVRRAEQAQLLREQGALHVCSTDSPSFLEDLTAALVATGATLGFDAIGGGRLAGQILGAMEVAINLKATEYSRYGSSVHKQVYVYGALDTGPIELGRNVGMAWGVGGWLLMPFLQRVGPGVAAALKQRVAAELTTTFASQYAREISLAEALQPAIVAAYAQRATGAKYLINPNRGLVAR